MLQQKLHLLVNSEQECILIRCILPIHYCTGGISLTEPLLDRDQPGQRCPGQRSPWTETPFTETPPGHRPPGQRLPWTVTPLDSDPPGQRHPGHRLPGQRPQDRDPSDRDPPVNRITDRCHYLATTFKF